MQFSPKPPQKRLCRGVFCSYQGEAGGAAGGERRQRHLRKPRQTDQVRRQADKGPAGGKTLPSRRLLHGSERSLLSFQMFKGPNQDIDAVYTPPTSAVCGVSLQANGKEYLITGGSSRSGLIRPPPPSAASPRL